jgi:hypothetical protein
MTDAKLDAWIRSNYNVLFIGHAGVGKTAKIRSAFDRNGLKWKYFSCSSLDPWTELVGIPKEARDANGELYLDYVVPKWVREADTEAIFFDEFNRGSKKVRNFVMELLQFKTINKIPFGNLKFVWAAINPDGENENMNSSVHKFAAYDVEPIDPAQLDRFEIHVDVPYSVDEKYFEEKYGKDASQIAVDWWNNIKNSPKKEESELISLVTPRRLDTALKVFFDGNDPRDVLHKKLPVGSLISQLSNGSVREEIIKFFEAKDKTSAAKFIKNENNYLSSIRYITVNPELLEFYFEFIPEEKKNTLISSNEEVKKFVFMHSDIYLPVIQRVCISDKKFEKSWEKHRRSRESKLRDFANFTFANSKLKHVPEPDSSVRDITPYDSYLHMVEVESNESAKGTHYRRNLYKLILSFLRTEFGYTNSTTNPKKRLTEKELEVTLTALNDIINSTTTMENFKEFPHLYGFVCAEYLNQYGKKQNYNNLSKRITEFLLLNSILYV